jgi:hypothetical protein
MSVAEQRQWCRRRSGAPAFFALMLALLHRVFQLFLVIARQGMNFAMHFIADGANLRHKPLCRRIKSNSNRRHLVEVQRRMAHSKVATETQILISDIDV